MAAKPDVAVSRIARAWALLLALCCLGPAIAVPNDDIAVTDEERAEATRHIGGSRKLSLAALRKWDPQPDGAREYSSSGNLCLPGTDTPERRLDLAVRYACYAAFFGIAEVTGARSFAGADGIGIFTKYRLRLVDDWRPGSQSAGGTFDLVMHGGEIVEDGETYRARHPYTGYRVGARYLVALGPGREGLKPGGYVEPDFLVEVDEGTIRTAIGAAPVVEGAALQEARAEFDEAMADHGCNRPFRFSL